VSSKLLTLTHFDTTVLLNVKEESSKNKRELLHSHSNESENNLWFSSVNNTCAYLLPVGTVSLFRKKTFCGIRHLADMSKILC
jgi:hypothetical protein